MRLTILFCIFLMGCASNSPVPLDFDITHATIAADDKEPEVVIDNLSGKDKGAAVGGAAGAGAGLGYAVIACMPAFMAYGACLAVAAPLLGGVGAASGAAFGAVVSESAKNVEKKREMLDQALVAIDARKYLATLVQENLQDASNVVTLAPNTDSNPIQPKWTMRIALNKVSTDGLSGNPYYLGASASLEVLRTGKEEPVSRKEYHAQTKDRKTTDEWLASEEEPVSTVIEYLLTAIASDILKDLLPDQMGQENQLEIQPLYAKLKTNEVMPGSNTSLPSIPIIGPTVSKSGNKHESFALFDTEAGTNWIIVESSPVDLSTANHICRSLESADEKKYELPSLQEFEKLWRRYRNDERISIFKKREYCTNDSPSVRSYTPTFSFADGSSGILYAAYLACISK